MRGRQGCSESRDGQYSRSTGLNLPLSFTRQVLPKEAQAGEEGQWPDHRRE